MATVETLLTAEEYGDMPDDGLRTELVRGRIIDLSRPGLDHGTISGEIAFASTLHVKQGGLGRIVINDSEIITEGDPDTVRGADVAFYSYQRLPKGSKSKSYPDVRPELVIEVRSPSDRWPEILEKVAEYLRAGVAVVCVLDPDPRSAHLFAVDQPDRTLGPDDELTFPECLPGFSIPVGTLFE